MEQFWLWYVIGCGVALLVVWGAMELEARGTGPDDFEGDE